MKIEIIQAVHKIRNFIKFLGPFGLFIGGLLTVSSVYNVGKQSTLQLKATRASIRETLYQAEWDSANEENGDLGPVLSTAWASFPSISNGADLRRSYLEIITSRQDVVKARHPMELYELIYSGEMLSKEIRLGREGASEEAADIASVRHVFTHIQNAFYACNNAYDYYDEGVISKEELVTWTNPLHELRGHPLFIAVLAQAHDFCYISQGFAEYLQKEFAAAECPGYAPRSHLYKRDQQSMREFYPEFFRQDWKSSLLQYGERSIPNTTRSLRR